MNKIIALATSLLLSISSYAAQFAEGTHYKELDTPASVKPVVTEFFSFYCPHCYHFEPVMDQVQKQLPEGKQFKKAHVSFMGGSMGKSMAKAYATMIALDIEGKMLPVMFRQIHELKQPPRNDKELRQIFIDNGVEAEKYDATFNSFAVDSMQKRFDNEFDQAGLRGVPAVIVNNKYLLTPDKSISSVDEYMELVNYF
ncbi:thiol:disulfide interchange protein DsbA/DsbL [Vibrio sp. JC009]|uniref:thiol:disulfide interchange protein DsbA/DsbL n=1 Tax=Vibrio sp. JC009 TaxID=2912314 RepID=UPI0023B03ACA|nr:thiol:disulfide interchange protein DsbA/DsbL [Vibrio sp. JC009]WED24446.1 thiol:disulfide interchange protein DsbA/DsbL [Vibrio sp. JC009]